ncbi:nitrous oxide reductase accessory protein NosL [Dawidia soli]|uniref:Nitrous oxide reductase accessory protein NosL n=1 Tax=Dawidia soli TaxID=2782352 RepID=A0AAP2D8A2_9BACT|nr:nitrous oxide reductase accessory protein NosL [Dawidia soli]MBT1687099.1 nitrous oxide reductase accessory protein NosL [Dawidia soli]
MKTLNPFSRIALVLSAGMLLAAYYVPLWQILMWAPQYPEGLEMKIWIDNITGDVKIISALNHYIGMKHIEVSMFPEFGYMKYIVAAVIGAGLLAAVINKRSALVGYALLLLGCGVAALVDFYLWGYNYGHNLDPTAPIVVPGMSYQPPLLGTRQLLNFTAFSGPATGGWIFFASALLAFAAVAREVCPLRWQTHRITATPVAALLLSFALASCTVGPAPIQYGTDACHHCKMTLMDPKFGAEIVTRKGKVYIFDDTGCLVSFLHAGEVKPADIAHTLITDFTTGTLVDAAAAFYLQADAVGSPMASNLAAFAHRADRDAFQKTWHGAFLTWQQVTTQAAHP